MVTGCPDDCLFLLLLLSCVVLVPEVVLGLMLLKKAALENKIEIRWRRISDRQTSVLLGRLSPAPQDGVLPPSYSAALIVVQEPRR